MFWLSEKGLWTDEEFLYKMNEIAKVVKIKPFGFCMEPEQSCDLPLIFNINDTDSNLFLPGKQCMGDIFGSDCG